LDTGVLAGYPIVDIKVRLTDGSYHDVDSSEMAFKIAASMGFKEACRKAKPVLLEPVMDVEVVTPEEYMGAIVGDLNSRRGRIVSMEARGSSQVIRARVAPGQQVGYAAGTHGLDAGSRQLAGYSRQRAAGTDVRICDGDAVDDPGARDLHDAVRAIRRSAAGEREGNQGQGRGQPAGARRVPLEYPRRPHHGEGEVRA